MARPGSASRTTGFELAGMLLLLTNMVVGASLLAPTGPAGADHMAALDRLRAITDLLEAEGQALDGEPLTGTAQPGDTLRLQMEMSVESSHHVFVLTDSMYNRFSFWIDDPGGTRRFEKSGDMASFAVFPDSSGSWTLGILLLEADEFAPGDSASFAVAVARYPRQI